MEYKEVVIIGGGIMGCSLAYHLCREGQTGVLLLEKGELTCGSTWHAAGQITHSVSSYTLARMVAYGAELYARLEPETGQSTGWRNSGSLRVAYSDAELDWLRYTVSVGKGLGHDMEIVGPQRIAELHPFYNLEGIKAALHTPHDGHADPSGISSALARGARSMGAQIRTRCRVTGISRHSDDSFVVHSECGDISAHTVVNAGGTYARQIGAWVGLDLPIANLLHHYLVTEDVAEFASLERELPVVRDDHLVSGYLRMEQKGGLIGIYEKANPVTVWDTGTPWDAENELFDPDYDRIMPWLENALERMPVLSQYGIKRVVHGAITHPPDGNMMLGPSGVRNFWCCCGSQVGIAWAPGAGRYLAQWMVHGAADISMRSYDPRRFGARIDDHYRISKAKEDYLLRHEIPFPNLDRPACRPQHSKCSPLYETLKRCGAVYEEVYGWERPYWYAPSIEDAVHIHDFRRSSVHHIVGEEVRALRATAGIADLSAFAKIDIRGRDCESYLLRLSSNRLPCNEGDIVLSYLLLDSGRIEGEVTCVKVAQNHYYLVYAAAREAALLHWMQEQVRSGEDVIFDNLSEYYGVIMIAGPKARDILSKCTEKSLKNEDFRWLTAQSMSIANTQLRALRISYCGELGWELHVPMEGMHAVYEAIMADGAEIRHVGSAAINSMRMEKAYRSGHEITNEVTLADAGVLRFASNHSCQGLAASTQHPTRWMLSYMALEEDDSINADPLGGESIWYEGEAVGQISSGAFGYAVGHFLAFGYVRPPINEAGTEVEIMVLGEKRRAKVIGEPAFDPKRIRPRA